MNNIKLSKSKEIKLKRTVKVKCIYASDNINNYIKNNQSNKTKSNDSNNNTKQTSKISSKNAKSIFKSDNNTLYKKNNYIESKTKIINVLWTKNLKKINENKIIYKKYNKKIFNNYNNQSNTTSSEYTNSNFLNYELGENKKKYEDDVFSNSQFISIINKLDNNNHNQNQNKFINNNSQYFNNFILNDDNNKEMEFNLSNCDFIDESLLLPKNNIETVNMKKKIKRMKSNSLLEKSNSNYILNTEEFNENERILPKYIINNYRNFNFYKVLKTSEF